MTPTERAAIVQAARKAAAETAPIPPAVAEQVALLLRGIPTTARPQAATRAGEHTAAAS